jgi:hypothetical protein
MTNDEYEASHYRMCGREDCVELEISKTSNTQWCHLVTMTSYRKDGEIVIKSQAMAEQLYFMLGQMLGK